MEEIMSISQLLSFVPLIEVPQSCENQQGYLGSFNQYVRKIFQKTNISYSLIRTRTCVYQGARNISFSENFSIVLNKLILQVVLIFARSVSIGRIIKKFDLPMKKGQHMKIFSFCHNFPMWRTLSGINELRILNKKAIFLEKQGNQNFIFRGRVQSPKDGRSFCLDQNLDTLSFLVRMPKFQWASRFL